MPSDAHLWQSAASLAACEHEHQLRKDGHTPYVAHPVRVTLTVACLFECTDPAVIAAALLHDLIEDSTIDYDDLLAGYGREVADVVAALSKDPRMEQPQREDAYDRQLAAASWKARLIKLADVYDNLTDAADRAARIKLLDKARRAADLAAGDPELEGPRALLLELMDRIAGMDPGQAGQAAGE